MQVFLTGKAFHDHHKKNWLRSLEQFLPSRHISTWSRYRLLTMITWSPLSFRPNILIQTSTLREVLVKQAPPPTPRPAFSGGKEAAVFCPTPPVLPGIHTPASPCGTKPGPSLTNNHCSYPHIPSPLIHNQVLEIAENLSTSLSFVQATCFQTLVLNFSFQKTCCHNKP